MTCIKCDGGTKNTFICKQCLDKLDKELGKKLNKKKGKQHRLKGLFLSMFTLEMFWL